MISKSYEKTHGDTFIAGRGLPFETHEYKSPSKNDAERNTPQVIDLTDLNQDGKSPVNFSRKAGREIPSFTEYFTETKSSNDIE